MSNRLPVTAQADEEGLVTLVPSVGGLATALDAADIGSSVWVGWPGLPAGQMDPALMAQLSDRAVIPVELAEDDVAGYYEGFSNNTIWPLFHEFPQYASFEIPWWEAYLRVNQAFADTVAQQYRPGDRIWIHDYQLLMLPKLLRDRLPQAAIGFFLHIPFPTSEVFQMLPWREQLLNGLLGADIVGFHTYDYVRHFLSGCLRMLGLPSTMGTIMCSGRRVHVDAYPIGVDVEGISSAARDPAIRARAAEIKAPIEPGSRLVASVDRLDYTKGLPRRFLAFEALLRNRPEWRGRVTMLSVAVPSRTGVAQYQELKRELDEIVGRINGTYGETDWTPISYITRSRTFDEIIALYLATDVMMVTPLVDGMNLVAKEYVAAACTQGCGVLVLSERAGAAHELGEALIVNPYDEGALTGALERALGMPIQEQAERLDDMVDRLRRYDVRRWVADFLSSLDQAAGERDELQSKLLSNGAADDLMSQYCAASHRLLLLDYDGTLMRFKVSPGRVVPDKGLLDILESLARDPHNEVFVASGRDRATLERWLGGLGLGFVAENGAFWKRPGEDEWHEGAEGPPDWKASVLPVLEAYRDRTPGATIEEKEQALVWHFRGAEPTLAEQRVRQLRYALGPMLENEALTVVDGHKILEVRPSGTTKGDAIAHLLGEPWDFVFAVGDDITDEDMFAVLPENSWTVRVGGDDSRAKYHMWSTEVVRSLLGRMIDGEAP